MEGKKKKGFLKLVIGLKYYYSKKGRINGRNAGHVIKGALQF